MFASEGGSVLVEETPVLEDLQLSVPAGVLGIGFTIGSCFIGVPLAGLPVEERSAAITVSYCRD